MKKFLVLLTVATLMLGIIGCNAQLSDLELMEKAYSNMQDMESFKSKGIVTIRMMGVTMDPINYDILYQKPDKSYFMIDADILGMGETLSIEYLIQGDDIRIRSEFLDELEPGFRAMVEESLATEMDNPLNYEEMVMDFADMTVFEVIDNPDDLDDKNYKSYKLTIDGELLKQEIFTELNMEDDLLPEDMDELSEEEQTMILQMIDDMLENMTVEVEAMIIVNTKTQYYHSLQMDIEMEMPIIIEDYTEVLEMDYTILLEYLEVNTELEFPEF